MALLGRNWGMLREALGDMLFPVAATAFAFAQVIPLLAAYTAVDLTHWDPLYRHKIQKRDIPMEAHRKAWRRKLTMVLESLPQLLLFSSLWTAAGDDRLSDAGIPEDALGVLVLLLQVAVCALVWEVPFYVSHRTLHRPELYGLIHKMHHEFKTPTIMVGTYAHWIEHQILIGPVLFVPYALGLHLFTACMWYFIGSIGITTFHCGYALPWMWLSPRIAAHDRHHELNDGNYGFFGGIDWVMGTARA